MFTIIDYIGFRVIAMASLETSKDTIVYGSLDASGDTFQDSDAQMRSLVQFILSEMNIHRCPIIHHVREEQPMEDHHHPVTNKNEILLDIEGHLCSDKRRYIIDVAKMVPPEFPEYIT